MGFLRYFQLRQLPNFALAMPTLLLCVVACWTSYRQLGRRWRRLPIRDVVLDALRVQIAKECDGATEDAQRALVYTAQCALLSLVAFLFSHVQVRSSSRYLRATT